MTEQETSSSRWFLRPGCLIPTAVAALAAGIGLSLGLPYWQAQRGIVDGEVRVINNLKQIGLALYQYHEEYGELPRPIPDSNEGEAVSSWRVVIMPYLDPPRKGPPREDGTRGFLAPRTLQAPSALLASVEDRVYTCFLAVTTDQGDWAKPVVSVPERLQIPQNRAAILCVAVQRREDLVKWTEPADITWDVLRQRLKDDTPIISHVLLEGGWAIPATEVSEFE